LQYSAVSVTEKGTADEIALAPTDALDISSFKGGDSTPNSA
jgi:hypothetical protein